jgi:hypothetical protein
VVASFAARVRSDERSQLNWSPSDQREMLLERGVRRAAPLETGQLGDACNGRT